MTNEVKEDFLDALYANRNTNKIKKVHSNQFRMRCQFCGDSQKNLEERHLYVLCDLTNDLPLKYNCFKCGEFGYVNKDFLEKADITDKNLISRIYALNKKSEKYDKKNINANDDVYTFNFCVPNIKLSKKTEYINNRFGIKFNNDDYKKMKVITSLFEFLKINDIKTSSFTRDVLYKLEDHYVGFLTNGSSHILFRDITDTEEHSWVKYPIVPDSSKNRIFYTLESSIDILSTDELNINLSEGVFDTLGIAYQLIDNTYNSINIAVSGKYYNRVLTYLIGLGLYGSNVIVNIYSDNDNTFNKKKSNDTSIDHYRTLLNNYKPLYGRINVIYNLKNKDYGIPKDGIILKKIVL